MNRVSIYPPSEMGGADRASRKPRWATLYCPHCAGELATVPTDQDLERDYICPQCQRRARATVHADRCWGVVPH